MKVPYKVYKDLDEVFNKNLFDVSKPLFSDTETCGLYGRVRLLQLYQKDLPEVIMIEWPEPVEMAMWLNRFHSVWHNEHYDNSTIQQQTNSRWIPKEFDDTFLLARIVDYKEEKFALDDCLERQLGYCPYTKQGLDKKVLQKSKWDALQLTEEQYRYAATDVYFMPDLWDHVESAREDFNYKLDLLTLKYCLDFQWNGMQVDKDNLHARYEENLKRIDELNVPINVNSYKQVREYLGGITESDALALTTMKLKGSEKAGAVLETRKLRKELSFLDKFDTTEGRIYGKFQPSARSGRLTSKDQNLQQIPRKLKSIFCSAPGRVLWYSDYAQIELRSICAITACRAMEKLFRDGADVHNYTAEMLFGKDFTKEQRQLCKTYNFSLLYGGGINMLMTILIKQEVLIDEKQAVKDRKKWRNLWKEIYAWQEAGIAAWRKGRHNQTPLGRKYKAKLMTDFLNIQNQGCAADVFKLALHYMTPRIKDYNEQHALVGEEISICNGIHDSFIIEGPDDYKHYEPISQIIAESMQEAWKEVSKALKIKDLPMPVDVKVGYNWGEIEEDQNVQFAYNLEG